MEKIDLKDTTFIIPVRLDSINRLENLMMVVDFLIEKFHTNIIILEASTFCNGLVKRLLPQTVNYMFYEDLDPIFHRTFYINEMMKSCQTPFVAVWDSDVILGSRQILESITLLREKKSDFVYPYKDKFLDTSKTIRELYFLSRNFELLIKHRNKMNEMYPPNPVGGAFIANCESYINSGLENTDYYGWGLEDGERYYRWDNLDYKVMRVEGPMFHLSHDRGINSSIHSSDSAKIKENDITRTRMMNKSEMEKVITNWKK